VPNEQKRTPSECFLAVFPAGYSGSPISSFLVNHFLKEKEKIQNKKN